MFVATFRRYVTAVITIIINNATRVNAWQTRCIFHLPWPSPSSSQQHQHSVIPLTWKPTSFQWAPKSTSSCTFLSLMSLMLSQNIEWDFNGRHTKRVQTLIFFPSDKQRFSAFFGWVWFGWYGFCTLRRRAKLLKSEWVSEWKKWEVEEKREKTTTLTRHWKILPCIWLNEATHFYIHCTLLTSLGAQHKGRNGDDICGFHASGKCEKFSIEWHGSRTNLTCVDQSSRWLLRSLLLLLLLGACGIDDMLFETICENPQHLLVRLRPVFSLQIFPMTCPSFHHRRSN